MADRAKSTRSDAGLAGMAWINLPSRLHSSRARDTSEASEFDNGSNFETLPHAIESTVDLGE
jgi:hypothetical protein